jgi:hypothetical protein
MAGMAEQQTEWRNRMADGMVEWQEWREWWNSGKNGRIAEWQKWLHVSTRIRKFPVLKLALPVLEWVPVLIRADARSSTGFAFSFWLL